MAWGLFEWVASVDQHSALEWGKLIVTVIASATAAFIAYKFGKAQADIGRQQARTAALAATTARNKLRLDLFERRVAIYDAARFAIEDAQVRRGNVSDEMVLSYGFKCIPAKWLFDQDVVVFLGEVQGGLWKLRRLSKHIAEDGKTDSTADEIAVILASFEIHLAQLNELMTPYLLFTDRDGGALQSPN